MLAWLASLCPAHPLAPHMPGHNCPHLPPSYRATVPPTHTTVSSHPLPAASQSQISPPRLPRLPYKHGGAEPDVPRSQISLTSHHLPSASPHLWSGRLRQRRRPTGTSDGDQGHLLPGARIPAPRRRLSRGKIAALASLSSTSRATARHSAFLYVQLIGRFAPRSVCSAAAGEEGRRRRRRRRRQC